MKYLMLALLLITSGCESDCESENEKLGREAAVYDRASRKLDEIQRTQDETLIILRSVDEDLKKIPRLEVGDVKDIKNVGSTLILTGDADSRYPDVHEIISFKPDGTVWYKGKKILYDKRLKESLRMICK